MGRSIGAIGAAEQIRNTMLKKIGKILFYIGAGLFWGIFSIIVCLTHPIFVLTTLASMTISGTKLLLTTIRYRKEERRKRREDEERGIAPDGSKLVGGTIEPSSEIGSEMETPSEKKTLRSNGHP